jgi:membrane protease YdiL (CAAX protease family)
MLCDHTLGDRDRRESLMWMILAGAATLIPLGFGLITRSYPAPGMVIRDSFGFFVESAVLIVAIPLAVKINHKLELPGGPLITATLNREPLPYGWGEVVLGGVLWSVIFLVGELAVLSVVVGLLLHFFPSLVPAVPVRQIRQVPTVKPSAIWLVPEIVTSAFSAAVREEILFRFVLMGVFSRALSGISANSDVLPTGRQLWLANIIQACIFGLAHLKSDFHLARGIVGLGKLTIFILYGVFFGWLYLRKGLETSMVSHMFVDLVPLIGVPFAVK